MGGRGRGRGQGGTFTMEQLGLQKNEVMPGLVLKPPPVFPPLDSRPLPLSSSPTQDRLVTAKRSLRAVFRESPFYVKAELKSSWLTEMLTKKKVVEKEVPDTMFPDNCWCYFPKELIPAKKGGGIKRKILPSKKAATTKGKKPAAGGNILEKLSKLEEKDDPDATKEDVENEAEEGGGEEEDDENKEKKPPLNEDEEAVEDEDEEMDEGTDYANNYFDGGEDYVDEADDDVDEGPVF